MEFLLSRTYSIVTEDSARDGDYAEHGFVVEDERVTLREAVEQLREMQEVSSWPIRRPEDCGYVWATSVPETDWRTGDERAESVHLKTASGREVPGHIMFRLLKLANLVAH